MSDHSNMSIESPASSRAATPPTLDASQPLRVIPIGALGKTTKNNVAKLLQTDGVAPMSPRTVANTLANYTVASLTPTCYESSQEGSSLQSTNVKPKASKSEINMLDESTSLRTNSTSGPRKYMTTIQHQKDLKRITITKPQYPESPTVKATTSSRSGSALWTMDTSQHTHLVPPETPSHTSSTYMLNPTWTTRSHSTPCHTDTVPSLTPMKPTFKSYTAKLPREGIGATLLSSSTTATRSEQFETSKRISLSWRPTSKGPFRPASYPSSACKLLGRMNWSNTRRDFLVRGSASPLTTGTLCDSSVTARTKSVAKVG